MSWQKTKETPYDNDKNFTTRLLRLCIMESFSLSEVLQVVSDCVENVLKRSCNNRKCTLYYHKKIINKFDD